jgi:NADH-quinone oxidoreductase subunit H
VPPDRQTEGEGLQVLLAAVLKALGVLVFIGLNAFVLIWAERKVSGYIQRRYGPLRVGGPAGILQSAADILKLLGKEDIVPAGADRWLWVLAPVVVLIPAVLVYLVLPVGRTFTLRDLNIGLVFFASVTSFTLLAIFMAGWGSNNKYALIGAMRAGAQLFSYEIPLILSTIGVVVATGSLDLQTIVRDQAQRHEWFVFPQIVGFLVFYMASLAELNRTPFDLAEAESELIAGYFTEYSGMRWAMFAIAEYSNLFTTSGLAAALFLGGWHGPWLPGWVWFLIKSYALVFVGMWIRWTLPRIRIDQLLDFGWKFLFPVSVANIVGTALYLMAR